jgi:hypothetical protein
VIRIIRNENRIEGMGMPEALNELLQNILSIPWDYDLRSVCEWHYSICNTHGNVFCWISNQYPESIRERGENLLERVSINWCDDELVDSSGGWLVIGINALPEETFEESVFIDMLGYRSNVFALNTLEEIELGMQEIGKLKGFISIM